MRISILEQSSLSENSTPAAAIENTVLLAEAADRLGYERFWLSEHHNMSILQGTSPEVLLGAIGSRTSRIRIGSGGVMLPNHSAFKVAENFRTLEALYPGRIDCGIGRASGGDAFSRQLLNPVPASGVDFVKQVDQLAGFFRDECEHAIAMPMVTQAPPTWLLSAGSNPGSGILAAERGMGLVLALFINPEASVEAADQYRKRFRPSPEFPEPQVMIALNVVAAADDKKLAEMKKASDYFRLMRDSGRYPESVPSPSTLKDINFGSRERTYLSQIANREAVGLPGEIGQHIRDRALAYGADEVMLTMMAYSIDDKLAAIRLIAKELLH